MACLPLPRVLPLVTVLIQGIQVPGRLQEGILNRWKGKTDITEWSG
jgi:hypothetical protein